jgi:hypothetical protein
MEAPEKTSAQMKTMRPNKSRGKTILEKKRQGYPVVDGRIPQVTSPSNE